MNQIVNFQSSAVGQEISCVMKSIGRNLLFENKKLKLILHNLLIKEKFTILDVSIHEFSPQGCTIFFLLSESHLAIHTYPEHNSLYFNLYSCRGPKDAEATFKKFKRFLNPKEILFFKNNTVPVKN